MRAKENSVIPEAIRDPCWRQVDTGLRRDDSGCAVYFLNPRSFL